MDASKHIDQKIASLSDWRGEFLRSLRQLIREVDATIVEEWKWMGTPVWNHDGIVCLANAHKHHVKVTFPQGAKLSISGKRTLIIDFAKVKMARDKYTWDCYPASALANTPGARYDQLRQMLEDGVIDMATYRKLFDYPDVAGAMKQLNAPQDLADMLIERYLNAEHPDDPNVYMEIGRAH